MNHKTSWEQFFDAHAPIYDDNVFVQNTAKEIEFLLEELQLPSGAAILDLGCGTGRHAVALARRGFQVTGLDLSAEMLARAQAAAQAAGVNVEWIQADAARFSLPNKYDAAIGLCEGSLGLLGQGDDPIEQPLAILGNISRALKPGSKVILTVLNGVAKLRRHSQLPANIINQEVVDGSFDPLTLVDSFAFPPREGLPAIAIREKGFVPVELALLCRLSGLEVLHIWGGTAGNWGRRPLDLDEMEIMLVAEKTGEPMEL
ncbi:MAG: class I SAM-dependent methyltransferase [Candidatus Zixiibacteriota bacterium]|nr:MAG: class I SAM-dependent methyltransferase [candidate division Zixibacteria bacterium]